MRNSNISHTVLGKSVSLLAPKIWELFPESVKNEKLLASFIRELNFELLINAHVESVKGISDKLYQHPTNMIFFELF